MKAIALALLLLLLSRPTFAQVVTVNPTLLDVTTPSNYADVDGLGQPIVVNLTYNAVGMNGSGAVAVTVGLGKPTAANSTVITVPLPGLALMTVNKTYTATITSTGQPGTTPAVSDPSNPFGLAALTAPAKPSNVRVR